MQAVDALTERLTLTLTTSLRTCVNCSYFEQKRELCQHVSALEKKEGGLRPPARVIAFGCGQFDAKVPF